MAEARPRALIAGWFSFDDVVATVGDRLGADVLRAALDRGGVDCDLALAGYLDEGVRWSAVRPADYDHLVFTTGPLLDDAHLHDLLDRFAGRRTWAVDVSVIDEAVAARFDTVLPRDRAGVEPVPDTGFLTTTAPGPVVGVAYAPVQGEYAGGRQDEIATTIRRWVEGRRLAAVRLDLDLYAEHAHAREPAQTESLVARCDAVVTMRLHALVLALAHGVPAVAVDAVPGGAKVAAQAAAVGWPCLLVADAVTPQALDDALAWALTPDAARAARRSAAAGRDGATRVLDRLTRALAGGHGV